jgi:hypothetical protein
MKEGENIVNEAKFSFNFKFQVEGFESQLTVRAGEEQTIPQFRGSIVSALMLVKDLQKSVGPEERHQVKEKPESGVKCSASHERCCSVCGKSDALRLINFTPKNTTVSIWKYKCERCNKWVNGYVPTEAEITAHLAPRTSELVGAAAGRKLEDLW